MERGKRIEVEPIDNAATIYYQHYMNAFNIDLDGITLTKNKDGTYKGIKEVELLDEHSGIKHKSIFEYPRIFIKWEDNIEYGEIISIEILKDFDADNIWSITVK